MYPSQVQTRPGRNIANLAYHLHLVVAAFGSPKPRDLGRPGRLGNGDHDFASNVAGLDMANSFHDFAQRVGAVDNGRHCSPLD
jgi:hypothetical protein